jgi:isopenicillin N synthase-like dioxygenase
MEQSIPVVDLNRFVDGDAADQAAFVKKLGEALVEYGFVAVENHRVDQDALKATYASLKTLFDLPRENKLAYEQIEGGRQRGYTAFGLEHAKYHDVPDMKEFWHIGPELGDEHPLRRRIPKNLWPEEVPSFKDASLSLYRSLFACGSHMLRAIARFIGADENEFMRMIDGGNTILRLIRYPAPGEVEAPEGAVWAAAHEDINLITLLPEATDKGLQLLRRDGTWLDIHPVPGQVIADSGDMLQRLTNGLIPSTTHRVLQPRQANGPRYSIPFFMHPQPDYLLSPLAQCVTADNPRRWLDITAEGYLMERIREIGLTTAQGHAGRFGKG